MNYLAHAVLSPDDDDVFVGNLAGDFLRSLDELAPGIRRGVVLHRRIDSYTNTHDAFRRSVQRLVPVMGHYARAIVDVFYDHVLAQAFDDYTGRGTLPAFVSAADARFQRARHLLPEPMRARWHNLEWLATYAHPAGVEQSLRRLSRRSRRGTDLTVAMPLLEAHRAGLAADLVQLLPDLRHLIERENDGINEYD